MRQLQCVRPLNTTWRYNGSDLWTIETQKRFRVLALCIKRRRSMPQHRASSQMRRAFRMSEGMIDGVRKYDAEHAHLGVRAFCPASGIGLSVAQAENASALAAPDRPSGFHRLAATNIVDKIYGSSAMTAPVSRPEATRFESHEFLMGEALQPGVTQGAAQSNHVRQTAAVAIKPGMKCTTNGRRNVRDPPGALQHRHCACG
jgi:hypothetical protein